MTAVGPGCRRVFGIGWAKTGTTTLGGCLRTLGFDVHGQALWLMPGIMAGDPQPSIALAGQRQAFHDWPWILLYRELDAAFPGSRFVLTVREPRRWVESYRAMLAAQGPPPPDLAGIRRFLFGVDVDSADDEALMERYRRHNDAVLGHFRGRSNDLLVVDWELGHGWKELCGFLGVAEPERPFPRLNARGT
jgi:hypothetical protein